jgi:hypothetical protein
VVDPYLALYIDGVERDLHAMLSNSDSDAMLLAQRGARMMVDRLAIGFQAALLVAHGHENGYAAAAYIASRIRPAVAVSGVAMGSNYGAGAVYEASHSQWIIDDAMPQFVHDVK